MNFRTLNANEIDCRISTVSENGISLLLYKDARVDQNILDETVGSMNWQRKHTRDNANCIVSIWDSNKGQWIEKEDTGKESFSEAEKGLASDSFKRACFNWGIGRELYTAPFIWITKDNCKIEKKQDTKTGKDKWTCNDKFRVQEIEYNENKEIIKLVIINKTIGEVVFSYGTKTRTPKVVEPKKENNQKKDTLLKIKKIMVEKKVLPNEISEKFNKNSADMSDEELQEVVKWLEEEK